MYLYCFTYRLGDTINKKTCYSLKEANVFFDILLACHCDYIRIITSVSRCKK